MNVNLTKLTFFSLNTIYFHQINRFLLTNPFLNIFYFFSFLQIKNYYNYHNYYWILWIKKIKFFKINYFKNAQFNIIKNINTLNFNFNFISIFIKLNKNNYNLIFKSNLNKNNIFYYNHYFYLYNFLNWYSLNHLMFIDINILYKALLTKNLYKFLVNNFNQNIYLNYKNLLMANNKLI